MLCHAQGLAAEVLKIGETVILGRVWLLCCQIPSIFSIFEFASVPVPCMGTMCIFRAARLTARWTWQARTWGPFMAQWGEWRAWLSIEWHERLWLQNVSLCHERMMRSDLHELQSTPTDKMQRHGLRLSFQLLTWRKSGHQTTFPVYKIKTK